MTVDVIERRGYVWECPVHGDTKSPILVGDFRYCPADDCELQVPLVHSGLDDPENDRRRRSVWKKSPTAVQRKPKKPKRAKPKKAAPPPASPVHTSLLLGKEPAATPAPSAPEPEPTPPPEPEVPMTETTPDYGELTVEFVVDEDQVDDLAEIRARHERLTTSRGEPDPAARKQLEADLRALVFEDVPRLLDRSTRVCPHIHLFRWPDQDLDQVEPAEAPSTDDADPPDPPESPVDDPDDPPADDDDAPQTNPQRVRAALVAAPDNTLRLFEIEAATGLSRGSASSATHELMRDGVVKRISRGTYQLA